MKQLFKYFGLALAITISQSVFAGAGEDCHFHGSKPAAKETVLKCADKRVERLIARGNPVFVFSENGNFIAANHTGK